MRWLLLRSEVPGCQQRMTQLHHSGGSLRRHPRGRAAKRVAGSATPPLSVGIAVATPFISIEMLLIHWFRHTGSANSFGALFLLGVLVVSAAGGVGLAVSTTLVSAVTYFYFHLARDGSFVVNG